MEKRSGGEASAEILVRKAITQSSPLYASGDIQAAVTICKGYEDSLIC